MRIDKKVYKYIDYELQHFEENKKKLEELRLDIIDSSPEPSDGQPKGNSTGNPTEQKGMKLVSSTALLKIESTIKVIDKVYNQLNDEYKLFFNWNYKENAGIVRTCQEVNISEKTYYRWRDEIVYVVGREMGLIWKNDKNMTVFEGKNVIICYQWISERNEKYVRRWKERDFKQNQ